MATPKKKTHVQARERERGRAFSNSDLPVLHTAEDLLVTSIVTSQTSTDRYTSVAAFVRADTSSNFESRISANIRRDVDFTHASTFATIESFGKQLFCLRVAEIE